MLKVGGENVACIEVEDYLVRHPAVNIAVVTGVRDARYDEVPAAFVQLAPGTSLTEEELIAFCTGQIATYKVPGISGCVPSGRCPGRRSRSSRSARNSRPSSTRWVSRKRQGSRPTRGRRRSPSRPAASLGSIPRRLKSGISSGELLLVESPKDVLCNQPAAVAPDERAVVARAAP